MLSLHPSLRPSYRLNHLVQLGGDLLVPVGGGDVLVQGLDQLDHGGHEAGEAGRKRRKLLAILVPCCCRCCQVDIGVAVHSRSSSTSGFRQAGIDTLCW